MSHVLNRWSVLTFLFLLLGVPCFAQQTLTCSSNDGRKYCAADTRGGVTMVRQRSGSACIQGSTWGFDRGGIWVDRGCRADFVIGRRGDNWNGGRPGYAPPVPPRPGYGPGYRPGGDMGRTITCSSDDGNRHSCRVDTRGGVQMVNQRSGTPCIQGRTWGYSRDRIWVDKGCRADFRVR